MHALPQDIPPGSRLEGTRFRRARRNRQIVVHGRLHSEKLLGETGYNESILPLMLQQDRYLGKFDGTLGDRAQEGDPHGHPEPYPTV